MNKKQLFLVGSLVTCAFSSVAVATDPADQLEKQALMAERLDIFLMNKAQNARTQKGGPLVQMQLVDDESALCEHVRLPDCQEPGDGPG